VHRLCAGCASDFHFANLLLQLSALAHAGEEEGVGSEKLVSDCPTALSSARCIAMLRTVASLLLDAALTCQFHNCKLDGYTALSPPFPSSCSLGGAHGLRMWCAP
jgi:hypothetical protein